MKRTLTGPVHRRQTETAYHAIFAVTLPRGRTGYLGIKANRLTGEITVAIERMAKPDATGHSSPEDDDDDDGA